MTVTDTIADMKTNRKAPRYEPKEWMPEDAFTWGLRTLRELAGLPGWGEQALDPAAHRRRIEAGIRRASRGGKWIVDGMPWATPTDALRALGVLCGDRFESWAYPDSMLGARRLPLPRRAARVLAPARRK